MLIQGISLLATQDHRNFMLCVASNYTSPSSLVMYCYRQLTLNFELRVDFFLLDDMVPYDNSDIASVRLSVHTPRKEITIDSSISVLQ